MSGLTSLQEAVRCVEEADDDPEDTLFVALTMKDAAACTLGLFMAAHLFPEIRSDIQTTSNKFKETGYAQGFLGREAED